MAAICLPTAPLLESHVGGPNAMQRGREKSGEPVGQVESVVEMQLPGKAYQRSPNGISVSFILNIPLTGVFYGLERERGTTWLLR